MVVGTVLIVNKQIGLVAGKVITAAYVPLPNYHALFPEATRANQLLLPSTQTVPSALALAAQVSAAGMLPP